MPTKPNRAGNQQNYVPAGNGDASGEYGDNATGSNIHFVNFKKPDDSSTKTDEQNQQFQKFGKEEQPEIKKEQKADLGNSFKRVISNKTGDFQKAIDKLVETTNPERQQQLAKYFDENEKLQIKFGNAGRNAAGVCYGATSIVTNQDPHTIRHEVGHSYDEFYGEKLGGDERPRATLGGKKLTMNVVDEKEGKTFNEVLHEELGMHPYEVHFQGWNIRELKTGKDNFNNIKEKVTPIYQAYIEYGDKIFDKEAGITNARQKLKDLTIKYNQAQDEARKEIYQTIEHQLYEQADQRLTKAENDYRNEMMRKGAYSIVYSNSSEVVKAREVLQAASVKRNEKLKSLESSKMSENDLQEMNRLKDIRDFKLYKQMSGLAGIIGDISDYTNTGGHYYSTNGHGGGYFKARKCDGIAMEVFANMYDVYNKVGEEQIDCLKKALPRTFGVFERLIAKVEGR